MRWPRSRRNSTLDCAAYLFFAEIRLPGDLFPAGLCCDHLGFFLIKPTQPENKEIKQKEYQFP